MATEAHPRSRLVDRLPPWTPEQLLGGLGIAAAVMVGLAGLASLVPLPEDDLPPAVEAVQVPPSLVTQLPGTAEPSGGPGGNGAEHAVVAGDTASGIAARYGVTVEALVEANRLEAPDRLALGQVLVIPDAQ